MKFNAKKLTKQASLDEVEKEIFTAKEIKEIHKAAALRSKVRRNLADQLSKAIAVYMAHEDIGFNEFQRRLGVSSATASKLLKGDGNVTLETIALVSVLIGVTPELSFERQA